MLRLGKWATFLPVAGVAQLVERELPKLEVEGSNPFARSKITFLEKASAIGRTSPSPLAGRFEVQRGRPD